MAEYTYILTAGGPVSGSPLPPYFTFGDVAAFSLSFASGELEAGDTLTVAIDSNMEFYDPLSATGDASIMAVAHATIPDGYDGSPVAVSVPLNTDVFRQRVNGLEKPLRVHVGFYRLRGDAYTQLGMAQGFAFPVVAGPNAVSPVLPVTEYPTRQEAEALAERSENAAERAEEAAAGIVPPLQLSSPPTTSTVGSVGQLAVWHDSDNNKDHLYHLCFVSEGESATLYHWEECVLESARNIAGGFLGLDVNGRVSLQNSISVGISNLNTGQRILSVGYYNDNSAYDAALVGYGLKAFSQNALITGKYNVAKQGLRLVGNGLNSANRKNIEELSVNGDHYITGGRQQGITEIPAATSDYTFVEGVFAHVPSTAPTYRMPSVLDTTRTHYIELTVDFTAVQTYSFLDHAGEPIVPLFTPSVAAGDVYTFKMEYSAIKAAWLIYPQKQGAVADDFVMRGEVGAANGVAGLDANAKVPSGQLPFASFNTFGAVRVYSAKGISFAPSDYLAIVKSTEAEINDRTSIYKPIVSSNLNYAVTAAITDANHITLTDAQKATAQEVFGVPVPLFGTTAPTTSTVGVVGQLYVNTTTSRTYHCTGVSESGGATSYVWTDGINSNGGTLHGALKYVTGTWQVGLQQYALVCGASLNNITTGSIISGYHPTGTQTYQIVCGQYNTSEAGVLVVGNGTAQQTSNALVLKNNGNLYIAGGHQQGVTVIPSATTAYTLAEGVQHHTPEAASVYNLPAVTNATRTHECILSIKFSANVLTYEFQDSAGNTLVPLPLNGDIEDGSVVTFYCRYESLLSQWVIMPVMVGKEAQA